MITGVQLITGLIGSGKTLRAVQYIDKEVRAGRAVYVCNINGLNIPGVIPFDDPKQWQDLPPGSLLVVDEAQRFWRARRTAEVPPELQAMETSRHDAVSFLLLTQQPTYLDKHLRGLVTRHEHLYRRMGLPSSQLFSWDRCIDDPQAPGDKDGADQSVFVYPKDLFGKYQSAEQHTVKPRLGMRMKLIIAAFVVVALMIAYIVKGIASSAETPKPPASAGWPPPAATRTAGGTLSPNDYLARMVPRLQGAPWSAPIFDDRKAQSEPAMFCMASGAGSDFLGKDKPASCTCLTEQGTRVEIEAFRCETFARNGPPYNPYKREDNRNRNRNDPRQKDRQQTASALPAGASIAGSDADYGEPVEAAL
ncbi:MAG: zonular occludens toxin domain-containing protein [Cypionkella sp.]